MLSPEEYFENSLIYGDLDAAGGSVAYDKDPTKFIPEKRENAYVSPLFLLWATSYLSSNEKNGCSTCGVNL